MIQANRISSISSGMAREGFSKQVTPIKQQRLVKSRSDWACVHLGIGFGSVKGLAYSGGGGQLGAGGGLGGARWDPFEDSLKQQKSAA